MFWSTNITWNSGVRLGSRRGLQGLDDHLERQVLVLVGAQRDLANAMQQRAEARVAREAGPQGQHVHEVADQSLHLGPTTVGDRRADHDVVLAAVAMEQGLERGQQQHERRHPLAAAEHAASGSATVAGIVKVWIAPREVRIGGRGRSVGSSSGVTPASRCDQ